MAEETPVRNAHGSSEPPADQRLDSWKDIAAYLKRDVKTVQRWERTEGLPVRRHPHLKRGTVYAFKPELDAWWCDGHARLEAIEAAQAEKQTSRTGWHLPPGTIGIGLAVVALVLAALVGLNVGGLREQLFAPAVPKIDSIAVLPLKNLSGDPEQDYFVEGMHEQLITELSKISALRVISRTSAMRYKGTDKAMPEIARELGVAGLIEGSVLREGHQVRISVQLIHGPTDEHLWAETYQRELRSVLVLQGEVARAIAREIRVTVTPAEATRLAAAHPVNPEAHQLYLRGLYQWHKRNEEGVRKSIEFFQEAIETEPSFALPWSGLAFAYGVLGDNGIVPPEQAYPRARATALKALELDETSAEAHTALALIQFSHDWDWAGAERSVTRALELNPGYADARYLFAHLLGHIGQLERGILEIRKARELDPLHPRLNANVGRMLYWARRYDEAIADLQAVVAADPDNMAAHLHLARVYVDKGLYEEARSECETVRRLEPRHPMATLCPLYVHAATARKSEVRKNLAALREPPRKQYFSPYEVSIVYALLGDNDEAIALLQRAYAERAAGLEKIKIDPPFDLLRDDPRFQDLLRRMNFPEN